MTTLTIRLTDEQKRLIKMKAIYEGKTVTDFLLEVSGAKKKGTIYQAMKDLKERNVIQHKSVDELIKSMEKW